MPTKAILDAQRAMKSADLAAKCVPDEYAAAQRMMDRMREMVKKERYSEAEDAARTAQELFEQAQRKAEAQREACLRRLAEQRRPPDRGLRPPAFSSPSSGDGEDSVYEMSMVFFSFNDSTLDEQTRGSLKRHAQWLNLHTEVKLQISGHCDERGSTEYNLALGESRARAVRRYLVSLGVQGDRLSIISYGEELPLSAGSSEDGYRRNRRAEFKKR